MTEVQEQNFRNAFNNVNAMKRSYALLTIEKSKQYPSSHVTQQHELNMVQAMLQIELSIRALQREAREENTNGSSEM